MSRQSIRPPAWQNELLAIVAFVAVLLLIGLIGLVWGSWGRIVMIVTPTPTATEAPTVTSTPDIRATQISNEILTQVALLVTPTEGAPVGTITPSGTGIPIPESSITPTSHLVAIPAISADPTLTATAVVTTTERVTVAIPSVVDNVPVTPTATVEIALTVTVSPAQPLSATATIAPDAIITPTVIVTATPVITVVATLTPTLEPTPEPTLVPTLAPTLVPTLPPTPAPTAGPTPTPTPFTMAELKGFVRDVGIVMRRGPSHFYESTKAISGNTEVQLLGRDPTGEWLYICCQDGERGWVRQVNALPRDNPIPDGMPDDFKANDARWLRIEPFPSGLTAPPVSPGIPPGTFPLYRYDRTNQARLPALPVQPFTDPWPPRERTQGEMLSPAVVSAQAVLATSEDAHLYSFRKSNGDQLWRVLFDGQQIRTSPAIRDSFIYVATDGGEMYALQDAGNSADQHWTRTLDANGKRLTPIDGINMLADTLFISARSDAEQYLVALKRGDGAYQFDPVQIPGNAARYPAIGYQLVYVGNQSVTAIDVHDGTVVWQQDQIPDEPDRIAGVTAPPVYSSPGVLALSELYVADASGAIYALNANTGRKLWRYTSNDITTGLAVDDSMVYASGENFLMAVARENGEQRWRISLGNRIIAGPFSSGDALLIITNTGNVELRNITNGEPFYSSFIGANVINAPAIAPPYIFMPSGGKSLRTFKGVE